MVKARVALEAIEERDKWEKIYLTLLEDIKELEEIGDLERLEDVKKDAAFAKAQFEYYSKLVKEMKTASNDGGQLRNLMKDMK